LIHKKSINASKGAQQTSAELIMHCTLHYLAGGSVHDIQTAAGILSTSFYHSVFHGIDTINHCHKLAIEFPITMEEFHNSVISILCPGGTGDSKALFSSDVNDLVESLPNGFYVVADNAYTLSCKLLIPHSFQGRT
jgi:hypothetical protein